MPINQLNVIEESAGNVYADLGISNPELALAKAEIARHITNIIAEKGLTQAQAAKILGADQSKVSAMVRGRLRGFTTDRLLGYVKALGRDVTIGIATRSVTKREARIHVLKSAIPKKRSPKGSVKSKRAATRKNADG